MHVRQELLRSASATGEHCTWRSNQARYLVANGGEVVATCVDIVDTGATVTSSLSSTRHAGADAAFPLRRPASHRRPR